MVEIEMNADSHFVIGKKHITQNSPCQDHALCGQSEDASFVVVSDGCSSGRHTDIGARIITCAVMKTIKECLSFSRDMEELPQMIHHSLAMNARYVAAAMGLTNQDLLATCVYAVLTPAGGFVHILGDGHTILKFKNGDIRLINTEWQNNTPYYPADNRKSAFVSSHSRTENGVKSLTVKTVSSGQRGDSEEELVLNIQQAVLGYIVPLSVEDIEALEVVVLASDGIGNFKKGMEFIPPLEVARELVAFKTWLGEFVKRRLSKGLLTFNKEGIVPDDDVALAAIHITTKNETA